MFVEMLTPEQLTTGAELRISRVGISCNYRWITFRPTRFSRFTIPALYILILIDLKPISINIVPEF